MRRVVTQNLGRLLALPLVMLLTAPSTPAALAQNNIVTDRETYNLLTAGMNFLQSNNNIGAAEKFQQVLARDPNNKYAESNLAVALIRQGKYTDALPILQKCQRENPNEPSIYVNLATSYQSVGKVAESIDCLNQFLKLAPNSPEAPRVRSMVTMLQQEQRQRPQGAAAGSDMGADYLADAKANGLMRFKKERMPLKIYFKPSDTVPGYKSEFDENIKDSFSAWQQASQGELSFVYVPRMEDSDISVGWTNDPSKMISSAEGGHAMVVPSAKGIVRSDITLLTKSNNPAGLTKSHLNHLALHEIGHAMGIMGHSPKSEDVMYGIIMPTDTLSELSPRDKQTMFLLYSGDDSQITAPDITKQVSQGDPNSPITRMVKLNAEGGAAMNSGNFPLAMQKFEEALKIDPTNFMLQQNLAGLYVNMSAMAGMKRDLPAAESYISKAIPMLEKNPDKSNLKIALTNYGRILNMMGKSAEAAKVNARLNSLK